MYCHSVVAPLPPKRSSHAYVSSQWFRNLVDSVLADKAPAILRPVAPVVIVDQLEELMKRFPVETLGWVKFSVIGRGETEGSDETGGRGKTGGRGETGGLGETGGRKLEAVVKL